MKISPKVKVSTKNVKSINKPLIISFETIVASRTSPEPAPIFRLSRSIVERKLNLAEAACKPLNTF